MARGQKPEPKPTPRDIRHFERTKNEPLQAFCPKCKVYYPQTSNAHAGH